MLAALKTNRTLCAHDFIWKFSAARVKLVAEQLNVSFCISSFCLAICCDWGVSDEGHFFCKSWDNVIEVVQILIVSAVILIVNTASGPYTLMQVTRKLMEENLN